MLKLGDRIIFDVTGNNQVSPVNLKDILGAALFILWIKYDGCEAEVVQIVDQAAGYFDIKFDEDVTFLAVSKIHFEDLIEGKEEEILTVDQRSIAIELLMREHSAICEDDFDEVTNLLLGGFPGYEKMKGLELIKDLTDQGLHPEYVRRTIDLKVGDRVKVVGGVNNDRDLGFEKIFKDAVGEVSEINDDRPTPISVNCVKIKRHDSFWRSELELLGRKTEDG